MIFMSWFACASKAPEKKRRVFVSQLYLSCKRSSDQSSADEEGASADHFAVSDPGAKQTEHTATDVHKAKGQCADPGDGRGLAGENVVRVELLEDAPGEHDAEHGEVVEEAAGDDDPAVSAIGRAVGYRGVICCCGILEFVELSFRVVQSGCGREGLVFLHDGDGGIGGGRDRRLVCHVCISIGMYYNWYVL